MVGILGMHYRALSPVCGSVYICSDSITSKSRYSVFQFCCILARIVASLPADVAFYCMSSNSWHRKHSFSLPFAPLEGRLNRATYSPTPSSFENRRDCNDPIYRRRDNIVRTFPIFFQNVIAFAPFHTFCQSGLSQRPGKSNFDEVYLTNRSDDPLFFSTAHVRLGESYRFAVIC
jgi:hypothetical protein